jgi:integrase
MLTEPIRDKKKLRQLADYCLLKGQYRNHALIVLGAHTALRISDLLQLTWNEVYNENNGRFFTHIFITETKTGKSKSIALHGRVVNALNLLFPHKRDAYIFSNNKKEPAPISRVQAWRIVKAATRAIGLMDSIACHSLRKTFGYHAWINGTSPVVLMDIYNHSSYETTRRYLGVSQDDVDKVYMETALF